MLLSGQELSSRDGLDGSAHENAIHDDIVADCEISRGEFVFGGNVLGERVTLASEFDSIAGFQVGEGDQNIVAGIELENGARHARCPVWIRRLLEPPIAPVIVKHRSGEASAMIAQLAASRQNRCAVAAENGLPNLRLLSEQVSLHDFDSPRIRSSHQAHRPIRADHEAIRPERFKGDVEKRDDLLGLANAASRLR